MTLLVERSWVTAAGSASRKAPGEIGTRIDGQIGAPGGTTLSRAVDGTSPGGVVEFASQGQPVHTEKCAGQTQNISRTAGYRGMRKDSRSTSGIGCPAEVLSRPASYNTTVLRTMDSIAGLLPQTAARVHCRRPGRWTNLIAEIQSSIRATVTDSLPLSAPIAWPS